MIYGNFQYDELLFFLHERFLTPDTIAIQISQKTDENIDFLRADLVECYFYQFQYVRKNLRQLNVSIKTTNILHERHFHLYVVHAAL